jgi:predicted PurR-regulated permease PerM
MNRLVRYAFVILATLTLLVLLWQFRGAIVAFLISLLIAATIRPLIAWLVGRGLPSGAAQGVVYATVALIVGSLVYGFGPALFNDINSLIDESLRAYERFYPDWLTGTAWQQAIIEQLPPAPAIISAIAGDGGIQIANTLLGVTQGLFGWFSDTLLIVILSVYWSQDQNRFERLWLSLLPAQERIFARNAWRTTETVIGAFLRSTLLQSLLVAVILAVTFRFLGIPYPTLLAAGVAVAWLVVWLLPRVGIILISALVFALIFFNTSINSLLLALAGAALTAAVLGFLQGLVEPRIFNRRRFSSVLTLILVIPLVSNYGILGLLIAPPLRRRLANDWERAHPIQQPPPRTTRKHRTRHPPNPLRRNRPTLPRRFGANLPPRTR